MTPASNTLYTLALFFALAVLNLWKTRRERRVLPGPSSAEASWPGLRSRSADAAATPVITHALPSPGR